MSVMRRGALGREHPSSPSPFGQNSSKTSTVPKLAGADIALKSEERRLLVRRQPVEDRNRLPRKQMRRSTFS
jgi:hypothetical protein